MVRSLVVERELGDASFDAAVETLGLRGVVDIITLVGYDESLALLLRASVPRLPDGAAPVFS